MGTLQEFGQQRLGLCEVRCVKAFCEPLVNRSEQLAGFDLLALLLPQPGQTRGGAQFPGLRFLPAGNLYGCVKPGFRLFDLCPREMLGMGLQGELASQPVYLRLTPALPPLGDDLSGLGQHR